MSVSRVRLAVAQLNLTVGSLNKNLEQIVETARQAAQEGAHILLTPELSLCGYPPEDLLLRPSFLDQCDNAFNRLNKVLSTLDIAVVIGHPVRDSGSLFNAASVIKNGKVIVRYYKMALPNREVFDEMRYFAAGNQAVTFNLEGICFGVNICEDTWTPLAPKLAKDAGAQVLLVPNASPYHKGKRSIRHAVVEQRVKETGLSIVYANLVGGQDELVFDGGSFAMSSDGNAIMRAGQFESSLSYLDITKPSPNGGLELKASAPCVLELPLLEQVYEALKVGVRDYVTKNGFPGAIIGLSGGVDSALTLAIAVDALGADKVRAVMMPSPYTADISLDDSREMVKRLGVEYDEISIIDCMNAFDRALEAQFKGFSPDTTEENIQARIRGTMLMALSNKTGAIVLTTGNKSEMAMGYCTLYGDMAGGFAVIKDVFKTMVYDLCHWRNGVSPVIPERIITRPPSAELRPDQKDEDSLPPYAVLDDILARYMEQNEPVSSLLAAGHKEEDVIRAVKLLRINEYKRRQAPVGIRVTHRGFGRDWRYPITSHFNDLEGI